MDPKQTSQPLDPKLQQVYDRVMGVNVNGDTTQPTTPSTPTAPTTPPSSNEPQQPMPPTPGEPAEPVSPTTPPISTPAEPVIPPVQPSEPTQPPADMPAQPTANVMPSLQMPTANDDTATNPLPGAPEPMQATMPNIVHRDAETVNIGLGGSPVAVKAKGKGISPVILILGAFVFLAVYALFWIRFFGYSIPFLGQ